MSKTYTYEHKGYVLEQTDVNWHYMIREADTGRSVMHCQCAAQLSEDEAKQHIEDFLAFRANAEQLIFDEATGASLKHCNCVVETKE